jgi:UDP-N-acetylmuramoyl-L-alanyl-D-glutamate--2,6-diaminopimelate ligase
MRLSQLLRRDVDVDPEITGVTADSRQVRPGYLFAALPGTQGNGRAFVPQALSAGAVAVLATDDGPLPMQAPIVGVGDVRRAYALAAAAFYGAQPRVCVAVTGTNGKTSVAAFCRQIFDRLGCKAASMGTLGTRTADRGSDTSRLTTPDAGRCCAADERARRAGASATSPWRPRRTASTSAGWTACRSRLRVSPTSPRTTWTITRAWTAYRAAKLRLFDQLLPRGRTAVLNADSEGLRRVQRGGDRQRADDPVGRRAGAGADAGVAHADRRRASA